MLFYRLWLFRSFDNCIGVVHGAFSIGHLEFTGEEKIAALLGSQTMPTILPGGAFCLGMNCPPARRKVDAGLGVVVGTEPRCVFRKRKRLPVLLGSHSI